MFARPRASTQGEGMKARQRLRRWHVWLGWIIALPFLAWTMSGLVMVARPIETVRGEGLLREAPPLALAAAPVPPAIGPRPVASLTLQQGPSGPAWIVKYADGATRLADARTGRLLPPLGAAEAARLVAGRYTGEAKIAAVDRTAADKPPLELRRPIEAWRVTMSDGTRFYVNASTGEVAARRTAWWRFYDFMWGLHIMDLSTREDAHNPLLIGFAIVSLLGTLMAIVLLPMTIRRKRQRG
jgi:uncharacterized iron-regulated membrane protein